MVLYEPEIPQNTANIMRTCLATGSSLHLIEPIGFDLDSKHLKRASANHLQFFDDYTVYQDFLEFLEKNRGRMVSSPVTV